MDGFSNADIDHVPDEHEAFLMPGKLEVKSL